MRPKPLCHTVFFPLGLAFLVAMSLGWKPPSAIGADSQNPFPRRISAPEFPRDAEWLNTAGPLRKQDLKGKFVLLDFWTYCCINCIHILPELKKLEEAYADQLVVIGIHSAKFEAEKGSRNIEEAILRYEIEHPVINDANHLMWNTYSVRSWPTVMLIDPEGMVCWGTAGEIVFDQVDAVLKKGLRYYRRKGLLDETPVRFDLLAYRQQPTPLRFPGKVLADEPGNRLFISDSNHNRIVVTTLEGRLIEVIGSGAIGREDGDYATASFNHPQGMSLDETTLYVADTENHLLRKVDLEKKIVTTIAGTGEQRRGAWPTAAGITRVDAVPGRYADRPKRTTLNSPWALWVHEDILYIAMAGPHQIWAMPLDESRIGPYAGNGREDIVDGRLLPPKPYEMGYSSFAQPSGLASDGRWLYVADSEGSSIRAVPFDPQGSVNTVVGTSGLQNARLFTFGDRNGLREHVLLQHPLGVVYHDGTIYVADTYNNKIKAIDARSGQTRTIAGTGNPGRSDAEGTFDEPEGITYARGKLYVADTNNHLIRTIELRNGKVSTLRIDGLTPPKADQLETEPSFPGATQHKLAPVVVKPADGKVTLKVQIDLPFGWKINPLAPMEYRLESLVDSGPVGSRLLGQKAVKPPNAAFDVILPVAEAGSGVIRLSMEYYYCQESGEGLCKVGSAVWTVPLRIASDAPGSTVSLVHKVTE